MSLLSSLKALIVPPGRATRTIRSGTMRGLRMDLDLRFQTQLWLGLQEREIQSWLRRFSANILSAVDVGMAEGEFVLFFLKRTCAEKIFAFEPDAMARVVFQRNLVLNAAAGDPRLELHSNLVGAEDTDLVTTLDRIDVREPLLVKVDVDGAEMDVLRGAGSMLARSQVRWIIETHTPDLERDCLNYLRAAGYQTRIVPNAWWRFVAPEMRVAAHFPENHNRWLIAARAGDIRVL